MDEGRLSNMLSIWPPTASVTAGPDPLYGTCTASVPVDCLKASPNKCSTEHVPELPCVYLPGLSLSALTNSLNVLAGNLGLTSITLGTLAKLVTGMKSLSG